MKLGAMITSERGKPVTKTGNERIEIEIVGENRKKCIGRIVYQMAGNDYIISVSLPNGYQITERIRENGNLKHGTLCNCGMNAGFHKKQSNCK